MLSPDGGDGVLIDDEALHDRIKYNMRKSLDLEQEGCHLQPGNTEGLQECGFNTTAKTILIIHGWTVNNNNVVIFRRLLSKVTYSRGDFNL